MIDFTNIIKTSRNKVGLTRPDFTDQINAALPQTDRFHSQLVYAWENGESRPSYLMAHRLYCATNPGDWRHELALAILNNYAPDLWTLAEPINYSLSPAPKEA